MHSVGRVDSVIASTLSEKPVQFHVRCFPFLGNGEARTFEVDLI